MQNSNFNAKTALLVSNAVHVLSVLIFVRYDAGHGNNGVAFAHAHEGDALGGAAHGGDVIDFEADDDAVVGDDHDLFAFFDHKGADDHAVAVSGLEGEDAFAAAGWVRYSFSGVRLP